MHHALCGVHGRLPPPVKELLLRLSLCRTATWWVWMERSLWGLTHGRALGLSLLAALGRHELKYGRSKAADPGAGGVCDALNL